MKKLWPADWAWITALSFLGGFELWAGLTGNKTLSESVWRMLDTVPSLVAVLIYIAMIVLVIHLFWRVRRFLK